MFVVGVRVCASSDYAVTRILQALIGTRSCVCVSVSIQVLFACAFVYFHISV